MDINSVKNNNVTLTLDFSIDQVKTAIEEVFSKRSMLYLEDKAHRTDTAFKMDVYNGINPACIAITMNSKDEQTTAMTVIAQNANGGHASDSMLTEVLKDYLNNLQKALNGDFKKQKSGCLGKAAMITITLVATGAVLFLI